MKIFFLSCLLAFPVSASAAQWRESLSAALEEAKASGNLILVDFQAPWCYSCYYMEQKVLSKEAFAAAAKGLVLLKIDVDQPEGRQLKQRYAVNFLPSYLLLNAEGQALGRIVGEQTETDFLARLSSLRAGASSQAEKDVEEMRAAMGAGQYDEALSRSAALPEERLKDLEGRPEWKILRLRAAFMAALRGNRPGAEKSLVELLGLDSSCDAAYDVAYAEDLVEKLPSDSRKAVLQAEQKALEPIVAGKVLTQAAARCADLRTPVEGLAAVYDRLGLKSQRSDLLAKTLTFLEKGAETGQDRNRDDNYRYFLELAGEDARLRTFYEQLAAAYPADYVYPYRYAKYLLGKKEFTPALAWVEKADRLAYGANRLAVTGVRARILAGLGRAEEAKKLLKRDIRTSPLAFANEVKGLQVLLSELSK